MEYKLLLEGPKGSHSRFIELINMVKLWRKDQQESPNGSC